MKILINAVNELLISNSSAVIIEITNILLDFPTKTRINQSIKCLLRFLNMSSETKFVVL